MARPSGIKQGKINHRIVAEGMLLGKKKVDIAREAGSLAKYDQNLVKVINDTLKSPRYIEYAKRMEQKLKKEIERLIDSLVSTELKGVEYKDKANAIDKLQKQVQLLTGGETERFKVDIDEVKKFLNNA